MKLFLAGLITLFLLGDQQEHPLKIYKLRDNLYVYTTYRDIAGNPFPSNSMYCVTDSGVILFDTPWDTTLFQTLLDSIRIKHGQPVKMCISTHFHDDRTAGINYFKSKGIRTYASAMTAHYCRIKGEPVPEFNFLNDTSFLFYGLRIETFYPGKGHSPDNIVLWLPEYQLLYGGCFVKSTENSGLGFIGDADLKEWKKSVKKCIRKYPDASIVIPGHFGWKDSSGLEHTLKLLKK